MLSLFRLQKLELRSNCRPGRLLQHLDQTVGFECGALQCLVLDEADRIMDMGFKKTIANVVQHLPPTRQTMLFSATQTKSIRSLATLSLRRPEYVSVHETEEQKYSTPSRLRQHYLTTEASAKFDTLFSFMRTHLRAKAIVFVSSCKQVECITSTDWLIG